MNEDLKSIKVLADELGINKLRIYRFIDKIGITETEIINTTKHYDIEKQHIIRTHFYKAGNDKVLNEKEARIVFLEKEINIKNNQISQIQNLLDQQQQLALQDKKLLEEYKAENTALKALRSSTADPEILKENNQQQEIVKETGQLKKSLSNWWRFWK